MRGTFKKYVGKRGVSWRAVVDVGKDPVTGKRLQRRVTAKTRRECEAAVARLLAEVQDQRVVLDRGMTVSEFAGRWLEGKYGHVREATHRRYADLMRLHILPTIGRLKMRELGPAQIQSLHSVWRAAGLSPTSAYHAHYILHGMLGQAVQWRILVTNPCKLVKAPRRAKVEISTWSAAEVSRVVTAASSSPLEALWSVALCTGMRRGELLGLMWHDIDFQQAELCVRRTLSRGGKNQFVVGTPKTKSSLRSIALPAIAVTHLIRLQEEQDKRRQRAGDAWHDEGFVFTNELGEPLHPNAVTRQFDELIAMAAVPRIRIHDLRHTNATLLLTQNIHPKIVQERLGHSTISMTLDLYSHAAPHLQRQAAVTLDQILDGNAGAGPDIP